MESSVSLPKLVRAKWYDAWSADWWMCADAARQLTPVVCSTVGYLLLEAKGHIILSQTYNDQDHVNNSFVIPKQMLIEVEEVGNQN